ncbi:MAG: FkbM family methyltransferase [Candidatus Rokubacteria bacterium]|nr:FkbM family methyltransferase [Candidatus Rokubacteria bacterium]
MTLKRRFGRLLRMPLRLIPPTAVVPVVSGPSRGIRWVVGSAPHGAWLGTLERDKMFRFMARLRPGMTVWDIGANVGLYTLPSARVVAPAGCVVAFEPMPRNLHFLRRHLALNGLAGVAVCEAAVSDRAGTLRMKEGDSPSEFHADPGGDWEVTAITLDEWLSENEALPPDVVKIDVEGSDDAVLRGGARSFAKYRPPIYLALHGERQRRACAQLLVAWGYEVTSLEAGRGPEVSSEWLAEPR